MCSDIQDTRELWRGTLRRFTCAAVFNLGCFAHGFSTGWVSGTLGIEVLERGSRLAAAPCLAAAPAAPFLALLADAKGRRAAALAISVLFILSWIFISNTDLSDSAGGGRMALAGRAAAGAGGAGALALGALYGVELAETGRNPTARRRGAIASLPILFCSLGVLSAYAAGPLLPARGLIFMALMPPALLVLALLWLPESPAFLISKDRIQDAAKVICWLNGSNSNKRNLVDIVEEQEVKIRTGSSWSQLRSSQGEFSESAQIDASEPMLSEVEAGLDGKCYQQFKRSSEMEIQNTGTGACRDLFLKTSCRHALIICLVLLTVQAGCGVSAVSSYASGILFITNSEITNSTVFTKDKLVKPRLDLGTMLYGVALFLGAITAVTTVDRFGRKVLLITSCLGIALCLGVLGLYCDPNFGIQSVFGNQFYWIPVAILCTTVFLFNIGIGSVPFVIMGEFFPIEVRGLASSIIISWMWISCFLVLRYYADTIHYLGFHGTCYANSCVSVLGAMFAYSALPETRDLSMKEILQRLKGPMFSCWTKRRRKDDKMKSYPMRLATIESCDT